MRSTTLRSKVHSTLKYKFLTINRSHHLYALFLLQHPVPSGQDTEAHQSVCTEGTCQS